MPWWLIRVVSRAAFEAVLVLTRLARVFPLLDDEALAGDLEFCECEGVTDAVYEILGRVPAAVGEDCKELLCLDEAGAFSRVVSVVHIH